MPIALTLTEGVLPENLHGTAVARITDAFLEAHQMSGNKVMTPNVTAHLAVLPKGATFSGGEPVEGAWIETKTPSFALANHDIQAHFFNEASNILHELSNGNLAKEQIWANGVHTVDGTWNISGTLMTNEEIGQAVSQG